MPYTAASPIRRTMQRSEVDLDALTAWAVRNGAQNEDYLDEYFGVLLAGCLYTGIDFWLLAGQGHLETKGWSSDWWVTRGNPAGLGVVGEVGGTSDGSNSQTWHTGEQSAFAHLSHMTAYLWGNDWAGHWNNTWPLPHIINTRFSAPIKEGYKATTLESLGKQVFRDGKWRGWSDNDPTYGSKVSARANLLREAALGKEPEPVAITFGRVPMPQHEVRIVANSRAWNDLGKRTIRGVVWHRMYGTLWGTDGYFRGEAAGRALTDFGVGVLATDGTANDGRGFMWNDPNGRRSPWANGPVTNPRGDGKLFVDRYGINGSQRDLVSIEISGNGNTALSPKARAWIVAATAFYADQYKVSHENFPQIPSEANRSFVIWHGELNGDKWGSCPGAVVQDATNAMIAEVKVLLKKYQETVAPDDPVYAEPQPVATGTQIINDRLFVGVDKGYTINRTTVPRLWADPSSPATGPALEPGANVTVSHMVEDVGEASGLTLVLKDGSRIPGLALVSA